MRTRYIGAPSTRGRGTCRISDYSGLRQDRWVRLEIAQELRRRSERADRATRRNRGGDACVSHRDGLSPFGSATGIGSGTVPGRALTRSRRRRSSIRAEGGRLRLSLAGIRSGAWPGTLFLHAATRARPALALALALRALVVLPLGARHMHHRAAAARREDR